MHKKKSLFVTFEGIEGSGKSYQSKKLYNNIKKKRIPVILTREPGGTKGAEKIRKIILEDYFHQGTKIKFNKYTDTLLYLAARNEHVKNKIIPAISKRKIIICDRFIDSTLAYQVYGKGVRKTLIDTIHKHILGNIKPDLTFLLKVNILKALKRLKKRKKKNRYDKFSKYFYIKAQKAFIKIAKNNKKRYFILDNSKDSKETEKIILNKFIQVLSK
jgi:dTMP kinase|tara:strand:- start:1696 stop:2343 length:648 start_codon:yes stop_codon:yes gene_type:complete